MELLSSKKMKVIVLVGGFEVEEVGTFCEYCCTLTLMSQLETTILWYVPVTHCDQSRPDLLEIALTDATEDNLTVALTPAA